MLAVVSLCLWRYAQKFQKMHNLVETIDSGLTGWSDRLQSQLGVSVPRFELKQLLGQELAQSLEAGAWLGLTYLPLLGLLGVRLQLSVYFLLNMLLLVLVYPGYGEDFERFFFDHHEKLALAAVSGYVYNM